MYSRRLKLNKKKPKPSRQKQTPGSNWGPRLALIERERALAGGMMEDEDEEELYEIHHEIVHSVKKTGGPGPGPPPLPPNGPKHRGNDPVLLLGRSSSPNYFYYNYSRRTAPNANQRKISCPEQSQPISHNHQRRASYVLGASSGYCSGSVTTLSTCANNDDSNFDKLTKPLTLIIPTQEKYEELNRMIKVKRQQKVDKKHLENFRREDHSQDSFQSSSNYESSAGEEVLVNNEKIYCDLVEIPDRKRVSRRYFHNPMANMIPPKKTSGILQISSKDIVQVHAPPKGRSSPVTMDDSTEPETLELIAEEPNCSKSKGSTITALAQGVTMVYVPMMTEIRVNGGENKKESEPNDLPELGQQSDDCSGSTSSSCRGNGKEAEDSITSNFILKKKAPDQQANSALDSLLDSFESVMFKPKGGDKRLSAEQKGIRKRPEQPPPLPPSLEGQKPNEKQKNLVRFALENLETVLNPSRNSSMEHEQCENQKVSKAPKKVLKKVTLSLPGEDNISSRNHELLLNYEELNNCSSEILSCGHVRNDDYSTISSLTSASPQEISDFDDIDSNQGGNSNAGDVLEMVSNSGGESDMGSAGEGGSKPLHEPRSVLQQLRDLSRLIRGSSPTKVQQKSTRKESQESGSSFFLHNGNKQVSNGGSNDSDMALRKTSDATDNSADSGKGSGSGSGSATSGSAPEGSSSSSAEPSPNRMNGNCPVKLPAHSKRLKIATIRGRGGGTRSNHYSICADEHCQQNGDDSCSQHSTCSCSECWGYRSDCNECQRLNNKQGGAAFPKPSNSQELCSNEVGTGRKLKAPPPPHKTRPTKLVRRTSSRLRGTPVSARRTPSLRRASRLGVHSGSNRKPVILDYCDCSNCDLAGCDEYEDFDENDGQDNTVVMRRSGPGAPRAQRASRHYHEPLLIPVTRRRSTKCKPRSRPPLPSTSSGSISDRRKISSSSISSGISSSSSGKLSRISQLRSSSIIVQQQQEQSHLKPSQLLKKSDAALAGVALQSHHVSVVPSTSSGNLFTIDEANEESVYGESSGVCGNNGAVIIGKGGKGNSNNNSSRQETPPKPDFQIYQQRHHHHHRSAEGDKAIYQRRTNPAPVRNRSSHHHHAHPKCWLAPDATLGWSDLESLYSQNMKLDGKKPTPPALRDECPTCWKELSEMKKNCPENRTVDRTKRMFIWLNRRHKEFHAPWWEAKKQASMRWLVTKAFAHVVPKDKMPDPFKESKKGKPAKYSLRDDIVKGLVSGKLYCMSLDALYRSQQNNYHLSQNLTHWEIIKILSRRGIYIAQPSDMKLTEATLRKKPIRTAAHIALIEALMGLYAKEILGRDRIAATLRSFGKSIESDTNSPERLVISWINTAVTTLKNYILSSGSHHQLPNNKVNRWMNLPDVGEIRDLCDGVGVCALFALYCSNDLKIEEISVPEPGDTLTIYDSITNHSLVQKLCEDLFPEPIYHLCVTDFLYIHGCMKQNILCFLVDLFVHLEINPILRVNRLTHVPIRVDL